MVLCPRQQEQEQDKKAQLISLLLHFAGEAVQDVMESLELAIDKDGEENMFSQTIAALDKDFIVAVNPTQDNGDGEPVRYQAQNTSPVLFFC